MAFTRLDLMENVGCVTNLLVDSFVFEVMWCISSVQSLPLWLVLDVSVKVSTLLHQESNTRFSLLQKYKKTLYLP